MVSQKCPSDVLASPIVPNATSLPPSEYLLRSLNAFSFLYTLDASANPNNLGICPAVGDISDEEFFWSIIEFHSPFSSILLVEK